MSYLSFESEHKSEKKTYICREKCRIRIQKIVVGFQKTKKNKVLKVCCHETD